MSVLSCDDCRAVLQYFGENPADVATLGDLAEFVCTREATDDRTRVEISLHHSTLPRLADAGLLDYDAGSRTVRYRTTRPVEERVTADGEGGESSA